ncbi:Neural cell adhesion molecule 1, partial [Cichlidogyrus casuarinus]
MVLIIASLWLLSYIGCSEQNQLVIHDLDENGVAQGLYGKDMTLVCEFAGDSQGGSLIEWYLPSDPNNKVKKDGSKAFVYQQLDTNKYQLELVVKSVEMSDGGTYTCRLGQMVTGRFEEKAKATAEVQVMKPISAIECPEDQWIPASLDEDGSMNLFNQAMIRCVLDGMPPPKISWRYKHQQLSSSAKYTMKPSEGLQIHGVSKSDSGIYTVTAKQPKQINTFIRDIRVLVFVKPEITLPPRILGPFKNAVVDGYEAVLECHGIGDPMPIIQWYKDNKALSHSAKYLINSNPTVGQLKIVKVRYPDDSGTYVCRALVDSNAVKTNLDERAYDERSITVDVNLRPEMLHVSNRFVLLGQSVIGHCQVRATDPVELYFQKLYDPVPYELGVQANDSRIKVWRTTDPGSPLTHNLYMEIQNTVYSDTWNYTCHARAFGMHYWWNTTINVQQVAQFHPREGLSYLDEYAGERYGWLNNATNISCRADVLPGVKWSWYRRGQQIVDTKNGTFQIISLDRWTWSESWLQIRPCKLTEYFIYDEYVCEAVNHVGLNQSNIMFRKASKPGAPIVNSYTVDETSVSINLQPSIVDGGMPLLRYELMYRAQNGRQSLYGPVSFLLRNQPISLDGLLAGSTLNIEIFALTQVGRGFPQLLSVTTKNIAKRPSPVKCVSGFEAEDPYSYTVRWIVPNSGGRPLQGYRVRFRAIEAEMLSTHDPSVSNNLAEDTKQKRPVIRKALSTWRVIEPTFNTPYLNNLRLLDLDQDTTYQLVVEAFTETGYSLAPIELQLQSFARMELLPNHPLDSSPSQEFIFDPVSKLYLPQNKTVEYIPNWYVFKTPKDTDPDGRPFR